MVKFYENGFSYDYTWQAVSLAYFLRYPNPYSTHVVSTDVISRTIDDAGRLRTVRLHLKRGKLPGAVARFLPSISESYILETSTVDPKTMTMETETRNLDHTSILSVIESQVYTAAEDGTTRVRTSVRFDSRLGNRYRQQKEQLSVQQQQQQQQVGEEEEEEQPRRLFNYPSFGFGWGKGAVQGAIEGAGARRAVDHAGNSTKGMQLVLTRLRNIGLIGARGVEVIRDEGGWRAMWRRVREEIPREVAGEEVNSVTGAR